MTLERVQEGVLDVGIATLPTFVELIQRRTQLGIAASR